MPAQRDPRRKMLGEAIDAFMRRNALTSEQMADRVFGEARRLSTINKWRRGHVMPNTRSVGRLAEVMGTTVNELLGVTPAEPFIAEEVGPARAVARLVPAPVLPTARPAPARAVWKIEGREDGRLHIALDVTLPAGRGMALARYLMDFGLMVGEEAESDAA